MPTETDTHRKKTIYIPRMADHAFAIRSAFRASGFNAEVLPESNEETLYWGKKFSSGKECFPFIATTGDIVKMTKTPEFDPDTSAFFMPTAQGPCRFGQYRQLQRIILDRLDLPQTEILSLDSQNSYANIEGLGLDFQLRAWLGLVAIDLLEKLTRETRPYELEAGQTDEAYRSGLETIARALEGRRNEIFKAIEQVRDRFTAIPIDRAERKPIIGMVGEIYIRSNRFCNNHVVRQVESLGGEVWVAPISEWVFYVNFMDRYHSLDRGQRVKALKVRMKNWVQKYLEHRLSRPLHEALLNGEEPDTETVLDYAAPYLHHSFGGEAILSVGKAVDYIKRGASGVINAMPFTCMPGMMVTAVSKRFREDFHNIPWLNMAYDGQEENTSMTRLQAFMHQAREYHSFEKN